MSQMMNPSFFLYFCLCQLYSIFISAVYNHWWIKNSQLELILSISIFSYHPILSCKNGNLGKCFINICKKKERISFSSFMPTITSYFGFLLAALTITSALLIGLSKIRLIWNSLNEQFKLKKKISVRFLGIL